MFADCTSITNVSFPNLLIIGEQPSHGCSYMFSSMSNLKRVSMPKLNSINPACNSYNNNYMFLNCKQLEEIEFPELELIGNFDTTYYGVGDMFYNCLSLRSARFPKLRKLVISGTGNDQALFYNCSKLTEITMPALEYVKKSGAYASYSSFVQNCQ